MIILSWSLWKVNPGFWQRQKEREFAYRGKPNPDQAAGIYCSVCNAHDKFCRWTRNLDFYMFSKRPQSNSFPSRTFLLYNIILVSKLNAIVSVERE